MAGRDHSIIPRKLPFDDDYDDDDDPTAYTHHHHHQPPSPPRSPEKPKKKKKKSTSDNDDGASTAANDEDPAETSDIEPCGISEGLDESTYCFLCKFSATDQVDSAVRAKMMELERRVTRGVNCGLSQKIESIIIIITDGCIYHIQTSISSTNKLFVPYFESSNTRNGQRYAHARSHAHKIQRTDIQASIKGHVTGAHGTAQINLTQRRHIEYMNSLMEEIRSNIMFRSKKNPSKRLFNWRAVRVYKELGQHVMKDFVTSGNTS